MNTLKYISATVLGIVVLITGVVRSFENVGTDFANYYTSSTIAVEQQSNAQFLYDDRWFDTEARRQGSAEGGIFRPFPPPTALFMIPLTPFSLRTAKSLWILMNVLLLPLTAWFLATVSRIEFIDGLLLLLATGWALINNYFLGQLYLVLTFTIVLGYWLYFNDRKWLSGLCFGLLLPVKYITVLPVLLFAWKKEWRVVTSAFMTVSVLLLVSIALLGWDTHWHYLARVLPSHLAGEMADPFSPTYQSWNSLFRSIFLFHPTFNPNPLLAWEPGFPIFLSFVILFFSIVTFRVFRSLRPNKESDFLFGLGVAITFCLLLAPATASYHFLLLSIPMAVVIGRCTRDGERFPLKSLAACYLCIAFLPVQRLGQLSAAGSLKILEYPRLYCVVLFFLLLTLPKLRQLKSGKS